MPSCLKRRREVSDRMLRMKRRRFHIPMLAIETCLLITILASAICVASAGVGEAIDGDVFRGALVIAGALSVGGFLFSFFIIYSGWVLYKPK